MTDGKYHIVAKAVRLEHAEKKDEVFIVFKVVDEQFKQHIMSSWCDDIELQVLGKDLVKVIKE